MPPLYLRPFLPSKYCSTAFPCACCVPTESVVGALREGGNVLMPCDTAGRLLELVLIVDKFWSTHKSLASVEEALCLREKWEAPRPCANEHA